MGCFLRMNSREMIGEFRSLRQALSGRLDSATLSLLIAGISAQDHALRRSQKLCHNCDTKPVFAVKTDFIDDRHGVWVEESDSRRYLVQSIRLLTEMLEVRILKQLQDLGRAFGFSTECLGI